MGPAVDAGAEKLHGDAVAGLIGRNEHGVEPAFLVKLLHFRVDGVAHGGQMLGQAVGQLHPGEVRGGQAGVGQETHQQILGQAVAGGLADPGFQEADALDEVGQAFARKGRLARGHGHVLADAAHEEQGQFLVVLDEALEIALEHAVQRRLGDVDIAV